MPKRLIVCSDGTWNTPEQSSPTNVVKMARAIAPQAPRGKPQIVFYDPGVGTDNLLDKITGGLSGAGLSKNVQDAYRFLVYNYTEGDDIYFFGFSRGAYTVRSTTGLIRKCGLLYKEHADSLRDAFKLYRKRDPTPDTQEALEFRDRYSRSPIRIKFIGVWDTVGSLGVPIDVFRFLSRSRYEFHDVSLSRSVEYAYHAVAIDERRGPFRPTLWEQHPQATGQVLEQVWFAGVHMDIGGGYSACGLSDLTLDWMMEKAQAAGLAFSRPPLSGLNPDGMAPLHNSNSLMYLLFRSYVRPIGRGERSQESVGSAACDRIKNDLSYDPPNLEDYIRQHGSC